MIGLFLLINPLLFLKTMNILYLIHLPSFLVKLRKNHVFCYGMRIEDVQPRSLIVTFLDAFMKR